MESSLVALVFLTLIVDCRCAGASSLIEFGPYVTDQYRQQFNNSGLIATGRSLDSAQTLVALACQDEFGLPDGVEQGVGLWSYTGFGGAGVLLRSANLTNKSPWSNGTLISGYRYANVTPIKLEAGQLYVVGCMLPGNTPYYIYINAKTTGDIGYFTIRSQAADLALQPADVNIGLYLMTPNAFFLDGSAFLQVLSLNTDYTLRSGPSAMCGLQFRTVAPLTAMSMGVEAIPDITNITFLLEGAAIGLWKVGETRSVAEGQFNVSNVTVRNGYAYLDLAAPVNLNESTTYIVAAHIRYFLNHTKLETKPSTLFADAVSVEDDILSFGYPGKVGPLRYSCVSLEVLPSSIPITKRFLAPAVSTIFPLWALGVILPVGLLALFSLGVWRFRRQGRSKGASQSSRIPVLSTPSDSVVTAGTAGSLSLGASEVSITGAWQGESVTITSTSGDTFIMSQKKLGEGAFGVVRMGVDSKGLMVAIKSVPSGTCTEEIDVLQGFIHPNIITLRGIAHTHVYTYIVMECATGGSLANMIAAFGKLRISDAKRFTRDILKGLEALHSKGIVHRDIKPGNVLYMKDGVAKLADFGIVSPTDKTVTSDKGTLRYMAPEAIKGDRLTTQVDIWAVGLTVVEMITGCRPWNTIKDDYGVVAHLHSSSEHSEYPYPEQTPRDVREFLHDLLNFDPRKRSTARDLLGDQFLRID